MNFSEILPGTVLGLREGLEAFLMIGIIIDYLKKSGRERLIRPVRWGMASGILASLLVGLGLWGVTSLLGSQGEQAETIWGASASLLGLALLTTFLVWMMKHGKSVYHEVRAEVDAHFSTLGLFLVALVMVLREGAEISLFAFSAVDQQAYTIGIFAGVLAAAVLAWLITKALIKVNLKVLFSVTLGYLVLQAAYLLGYAVHELLETLEAAGTLAEGHPLLDNAWNFRGSLLDHKNGWFGLPLNVLVGWHSKPEWLQLGLQLSYIAGMFLVWRRVGKKPQAAKP